MDDVYWMFERTNLCPYTDQCESFQTIIRAQSWMEQALARWKRKSYSGSSSQSGYTVQALQSRLAHLRVVKERCYNYNGRCLRFWQFKAKEKGEPKPRRRRTALLLHEYPREATVEQVPE